MCSSFIYSSSLRRLHGLVSESIETGSNDNNFTTIWDTDTLDTLLISCLIMQRMIASTGWSVETNPNNEYAIMIVYMMMDDKMKQRGDGINDY